MMESDQSAPPPVGNPQLALRLLRDFLQARVDRGGKRVWLSQGARLVLRGMMQGKAPAPAAVPVKSPPPAVPAPPIQPPPPPPANVPLTKEEKIRRLAEVKARAEVGTDARALGSLRETMVFAVGNPDAAILLVGEGPGIDEERQREPFVGKAGELLTKILQAMELRREDVYISNVCKFWPKTDDQTTNNRPPNDEELASCIGFVLEEIQIVQPRVIVALGATAARGLLGLADVSVSRMRGRFHEHRGIPLMVTYHPSYLLRSSDLSDRRKVWEDMLLVMEKAGMPISEKQRSFFGNRR